MNTLEQQNFDHLYHQHLINLKLQGKRPATIDVSSRAVRRITAYFDRTPDTLSTNNLKQYFNALIQIHSWSSVKLDRNVLQFFTTTHFTVSGNGSALSNHHRLNDSRIY
jgi:integrase/recombinase XerD